MPHTVAGIERARLAYEDRPRQSRFAERCKAAIDTDANGGEKNIVVFCTCSPSQHAEELTIDGNTIGVGTWVGFDHFSAC